VAKRKIISNPFVAPQMHPVCVECGRGTPHLFRGARYCADHHPDPGPHITQPKGLKS